MKRILLGAFGLMGTVVVLGLSAAWLTQPDEIYVERSTVVQASPQVIWPHLADLRQFPKWSPWQDLDPDMAAEFSEISAQVGAWYEWRGDSNVGSGRMTIKDLQDPVLVVHDLEFIEPWESASEVRLALEPRSEGTQVTWSMRSPSSLLAHIAGFFLDMDALIGADFEKGLARLAQLAEAEAEARAAEEAARIAEAQAAAEADDADAEGDDEAASD